ncbi:MAG: type IV secretory system conjugative DNA transfer family protein [Thermomicrobiales bacterium]|nr:MAG: type IV secretory system conjugative DNA transfer family protein [Thermomicrobiales bacterium]
MTTRQFPPRGSGAQNVLEAPPSQAWVHPDQLGPHWDWKPGRVLLGKWNGRLIGRDDDRHVVTLAGNRAGKTQTALIPNLLRYPGSCVVLDPKGELAKATAAARRRMGQRVFVFDPFGITGMPSASYNPFSELESTDPRVVAADLAQAIDAMVINNAKDPHWTDAGKNLLRGIALHILQKTGKAPTIRQLRRLINGTADDLEKLFEAMAKSPIESVANTGSAFKGKLDLGPKELQSILSTVQEQTASFDDVAHITERSDLKLTELRNGNVSIYLVLPGLRMGTHYRWLRLMIQLALAAMERAPVPRGKLPVWFVLEEFPTLGHMRSIETAAGLMAGYGVKLWAVLQDLTQLQTHYQKSWETFLGNAGVLQAFGNADTTTTEYLSKRLGMTQVIERQEVRVTGSAMAHGDLGRRENLRAVRLLEANEITEWFARETGRQLLITAGGRPIYLERLDREGCTP